MSDSIEVDAIKANSIADAIAEYEEACANGDETRKLVVYSQFKNVRTPILTRDGDIVYFSDALVGSYTKELRADVRESEGTISIRGYTNSVQTFITMYASVDTPNIYSWNALTFYIEGKDRHENDIELMDWYKKRMWLLANETEEEDITEEESKN